MPYKDFTNGPETSGGLPPQEYQPPIDYGDSAGFVDDDAVEVTDSFAGAPEDRVVADPDMFVDDEPDQPVTAEASGVINEGAIGEAAPDRILSDGTGVNSRRLDDGAELHTLIRPAGLKSDTRPDADTAAPDNVVRLATRSGHHTTDIEVEGADSPIDQERLQAQLKIQFSQRGRFPTKMSKYDQQLMQQGYVEPIAEGLHRYQQSIGVQPTQGTLKVTPVRFIDNQDMREHMTDAVAGDEGGNIYVINFVGQNAAAVKDQGGGRATAEAFSEAFANHALYSHDKYVIHPPTEGSTDGRGFSHVFRQHGVRVSDETGVSYQGLNANIAISLAAAIRSRTIFPPSTAGSAHSLNGALHRGYQDGDTPMSQMYHRVTTGIASHRVRQQGGRYDLQKVEVDMHRLAVSGDPHNELDHMLVGAFGDRGRDVIRSWRGADDAAAAYHLLEMAQKSPAQAATEPLPQRRPGEAYKQQQSAATKTSTFSRFIGRSHRP